MKRASKSKPILERVPLYLRYLNSLENKEDGTISATVISQALKLGEVQVRKDLSVISGAGKPRIGYEISSLIENLEQFLGKDRKISAVIVGAGKLGRALFNYRGFSEYGVTISAAFDINCKQPEMVSDEKVIYPIEEFAKYVKDNNIKIGIITVPEKNAQQVCSMMVDCSITAIWNFAPGKIYAPDNVTIKNENMAASLAVLANGLRENIFF